MLTDAQWMRLEPLVEVCRPKGKTPSAPRHGICTIEAIVWRQQNGAKWRAVPTSLGPGGWRRRRLSAGRAWACGSGCSSLPRARGPTGMTFLDGTSIRAHQKAAGPLKKGLFSATGRV